MEIINGGGLMDKLKEYGFSDFAIERLLKGEVVIVAYGKVKYNYVNCTLTTYYPDGKIKKEKL